MSDAKKAHLALYDGRRLMCGRLRSQLLDRRSVDDVAAWRALPQATRCGLCEQALLADDELELTARSREDAGATR